MDLLVTNTTVSSDRNSSNVSVNLYGRTRDGEVKVVRVGGLNSSFYVRTGEAKAKEDLLMSTNVVREIDHNCDTRAIYPGSPIDGVEVSEIICSAPWKRGDVIDSYDLETFADDVWLDDQFRIEQGLFTGVKAPSSDCHYDELEFFDADPDEFSANISYIDIECDDRGEFVKDGSKAITSIVGYNDAEEKYVGFFWTGPDRTIDECFPNGKPEGVDEVRFATTEKTMLKKFVEWIQDTDPDLLTGWNFTDYDAPVIAKRLDKLSENANDPINPKYLSREEYTKISRGGVDIRGRTVYDLLHAYKQTKFSELDSGKLDDVAQNELGEAKIDHSDMGYWEMYQEDPEHLLTYNAQDVRLCVRLNEEEEVISFWEALREEIGLDYEDTTKNSDFIEMMARRDLEEHNLVGPPTDYSRPEDDYDGGHVFPAFKGSTSNVVAIDLASLYPNTMWMANASLETKVSAKEALELQEEGVPVCSAPNGVFFRLDQDGVYKRLVDKAIGLKTEYKELRGQYQDGTPEYAHYDERYNVSKTVVNSLYGTSGWEPFFLYDEDVAEAVTLLGQACIKKTAEWVGEETVGEIIYGDTDSTYIRLPESWTQERCIEYMHEICGTLTNEVYPEFAEEFGIPNDLNRWDIEPEAYIERFFQAGKKKRYAYKATWVDGNHLDEPVYTVKGFDSKRSDTAPVTKKTQKKMFRAILDGEDDSVLMEIISDAADLIDPVDPDWDQIGIPGGIGKELDDYATEGAQVRGVRYMNALSGTEIGQGDKPRRVYLQPSLMVSDGYLVEGDEASHDAERVDVITFEEADQIPDEIRGQLKVDAGAMTEKILKKPLGNICEAVGIEIDAAIKGQVQTGISGFC